MIDAADLLQQKLDDTHQIWECQRLVSTPKSGAGVIRYMGKVGPECRGCGTLKGFNVQFRADQEIGLDDVLGKIREQIKGCCS